VHSTDRSRFAGANRAAVVVAVVTLAACFMALAGRADGQPPPDPQPSTEQQTRRICSQRYDYPGCSVEQQRSLEASTRAEMVDNYNKRRWGQSRNEWAHLSDAQNDRLRRLYSDAVDRFDGIVKFSSWSDFKDASDCLGNFKGQPNPVTVWCQVNNGINNAFEPVTRLTLKCGGTVLGGMLAGGVLAAPSVYAIPQGAVMGGAAGAIDCATESLWDKVWNIGKRRD
jgi:hypothetical protein